MRGEASAREVIEEFEFISNTILVTSGGIRANEELILRKTSYNYSWLSFIKRYILGSCLFTRRAIANEVNQLIN